MSLLESLASQKQFLKDLVTKVQWGTGRCPSCDSTKEEGDVKYCELARILEERKYKSRGHKRGRPTSLPEVWGKLANKCGGVGALAEEVGVDVTTIRRWAYCEQRPRKGDMEMLTALMSIHKVPIPVFREPAPSRKAQKSTTEE